jgi:ketosteroid isomerase-like protein
MAPNEAAAVGRPQVQTAIANIFKAGITGIKLTTAEIWGNEDAITEEGSFELNIKDGTVVEKGKYLVLWKKENGKWKLHRDAFNSNLPVPAPSK